MYNYADNQLISYVKKTLNSGITQIDIPASLLAKVSREAIIEVKRMCKLAEVSINNIPFNY